MPSHMTEVSNLLPFEQSLRGRRVLVTGHTGFTGSWLTIWLNRIGADVHGLALAPSTRPDLFAAAHVERSCSSNIGDLRDLATVERVFTNARPEVVCHLAAQPLVSRSCEDPIETIATNVLGTAHVLDVARRCPSTKAVLCVTTDKVYADKDWHWGYRENDSLGGKDPYSASKAAAEIVAGSFRHTFTSSGDRALAIATARGGNIIGGGDWSANRIAPDFVRALMSGSPLVLRNPASTRPWQHVLALVHGYMVLAARLLDSPETAADAWNFGPRSTDAKTVRELVEGMAAAWRRPEIRYAAGSFPETRFLHLDSSRARTMLGWVPPVDFAETVRLTAQWYSAFEANPGDARALCERQIGEYRALLEKAAGCGRARGGTWPLAISRAET
jgi:CDP-glucose 4,6-dehydratase